MSRNIYDVLSELADVQRQLNPFFNPPQEVRWGSPESELIPGLWDKEDALHQEIMRLDNEMNFKQLAEEERRK